MSEENTEIHPVAAALDVVLRALGGTVASVTIAAVDGTSSYDQGSLLALAKSLRGGK